MTQHPPRCFNREPFAIDRERYGKEEGTGAPVKVRLSNEWFRDECKTWSGEGIGQPTPEYPQGTPYPIAHGWALWCRQCRWMPSSQGET